MRLRLRDLFVGDLLQEYGGDPEGELSRLHCARNVARLLVHAGDQVRDECNLLKLIDVKRC